MQWLFRYSKESQQNKYMLKVNTINTRMYEICSKLKHSKDTRRSSAERALSFSLRGVGYLSNGIWKMWGFENIPSNPERWGGFEIGDNLSERWWQIICQVTPRKYYVFRLMVWNRSAFKSNYSVEKLISKYVKKVYISAYF